MTTFEQDLLKIFLDKVLLGIVAAGFGFYLARLLENYKIGSPMSFSFGSKG